MDQTKIAKQITDFYKTTFNSSMNAMTMVQEQTEKMVSMSLAQTPWIPQEGKKFVHDWVKACRKGSDDFKAAANDQYDKFESYLNMGKKADETESIFKTKASKAN